MQLKNRYYPYPVLIENGLYYDSSEFTSSVEIEKVGYNVKLRVDTKLVNHELEEMLKDSVVNFVHHIECSDTCYRRIEKTNQKSIDFLIKDCDVTGTVQVCTFLVAEQDINNYTNELFASDYKGFKFDLEKGCIMGVANQYTITIDKTHDDLSQSESIFSIIPSKDANNQSIKVNLYVKEKIVISLPEKTFNQYANVRKDIKMQPIMNSMIIIPTLIYTFSCLKNDLETFEDFRWYKNLKKACEKIGIDIKADNVDFIEASQLLINSPIVNAIEYAVHGGESSDED